ncbi:MAG: NlpC/P60 family protein [Desulfobacteraceae bacterium]|nr:MAG: NlpC/P60 family protein [Desulfobacteraceae bacterium]
MKADGIPGIRSILQINKKMLMVHVCAFLILCLALPSVAGATRRSSAKKKAPKKQYPATEIPLVKEMMRHIGVQYQRGGSSPAGVDCSGYVNLVYQNAYGLKLPRQSSTLYLSSDLQNVSLDGLKTGDLLFFTSSPRGRRIDHVGIYLWNGSFIHASIRKGVIVSNLETPYYSDRFAGARRVPKRWGSRRDEAGGFYLPALAASAEALNDNQESRVDLLFGSRFLGLELRGSTDFQGYTFRDSLLPLDERDIGQFPYDGPDVLEERASIAHAHGIGIGKSIKPFPWLIMTPSLSYFHYDMDEKGLPRRSIGLDLSFGSVKEKWMISTGFHHLSLIPDPAYAEQERTPKAIDMSFSCSRRLSDGSSVSLIGEQQLYEPPAHFLQQEGSLKDQRLSIIFNLSY